MDTCEISMMEGREGHRDARDFQRLLHGFGRIHWVVGRPHCQPGAAFRVPMMRPPTLLDARWSFDMDVRGHLAEST